MPQLTLKPLSVSPAAFQARRIQRGLASAWASLPELVRASVIAILLGGWLYVALVIL